MGPSGLNRIMAYTVAPDNITSQRECERRVPKWVAGVFSHKRVETTTFKRPNKSLEDSNPNSATVNSCTLESQTRTPQTNKNRSTQTQSFRSILKQLHKTRRTSASRLYK